MAPVFHRQTSLYSPANGKGLTSPRFTLRSVKVVSNGGTITALWRQKAVATHGSPGGHRRGRARSSICTAHWWQYFRGHVREKRGICCGAMTGERSGERRVGEESR